MFASDSTLGLGLFVLLSTANQYSCVVIQLNTSDLERPGKNLCNPDHTTVNCSNQINSGPPDVGCVMRVLNSALPECGDSDFNGERSGTEYYGKVNLRPYPFYFLGKPYPTFNITFTDIKWTSLKMRFVDVYSKEIKVCRKFEISGEIQPSAIISYDCLWSIREGNPYIFQYVLKSKDGKPFAHSYFLRLPKERDVFYSALPPENYIFMIIDQTEFPIIRLKLQVPPTELKISSTNVTLFYKLDENSPAKELKTWQISFINQSEGEFLDSKNLVEWNTESEKGIYYFNASFHRGLDCEGNCLESSTPHLTIPGGDSVAVILVFVVLILIVLSLGVLCLLTVIKKQKIPTIDETPPNVLFVYESSYPVQVENMYKMKRFLEKHCGVVPKFDLIDIPKSQTMNPCTWYCQAFKEANCVLVFTSPDDSSEKGIHEDNVYHNLHVYAIKLLLEYLLSGHTFTVACVKLPGCSWKALPHEARIVHKRFSLPEHLSKLLKFMNVAPVDNGSSQLVTAFQRPRSPPRTSRVIDAKPPSDDDDSDDSEPRGPLTVEGVPLNLFDRSTSEEEDDDYEDNGSQRPALIL